MSTGWALLIVLGVLVVVGAARQFVKGGVQWAREAARRDLIALGPGRQTSESLVKLGGAATYSFAPPLAAHRSHPYGWLWWCTRLGPGGEPEHAMGWAMTYRRARKAAGLPIDWRSNGAEFLLSPDTGVAPQSTPPADIP